jgi:tetratricopeptide (TPR) repeat protein
VLLIELSCTGQRRALIPIFQSEQQHKSARNSWLQGYKNVLMRNIICFMVIFLSVILVNSQDDYQDQKYYTQRCKLIDSLKYNEAIICFSKAIKLNPGNTVYFYMRGNALYKLKDYSGDKLFLEA